MADVLYRYPKRRNNKTEKLNQIKSNRIRKRSTNCFCTPFLNYVIKWHNPTDIFYN